MNDFSSDFSLAGFVPRVWDAEANPAKIPDLDVYCMHQAITLAMNGIGWSSPNPTVGCLIVKNGKIIGQGYTQAYRNEHAERMAFASVLNKQDLEQADVYVTLEPCSHFGNQPPCLDILMKSPIKRVIIGCVDPDPRVSGQSIAALKNAGFEVVVGVAEKECQLWHYPFLKSKSAPAEKKVWMGKWAQTASGDLCDEDGNSKWITGPRARAYTHWLRQKYDVIVVGANTWILDQPKLTVRDCALPHRRNPVRAIFDPKNRIQDVGTDAWKPELTGPNPFRAFVDAVDAWDFQGKYGRPLQSIFVEGGPSLLKGLMELDQLDGLHVFTGKPDFERVNLGLRMNLGPFVGYDLVFDQYFDEDRLQEWIKST